MVRIGLIQMKCEEKPALNLERAIGLIREATKGGAQVVCLPELFLTHYFCQIEEASRFDLAESIPGPTTERLCPLAKELGIVLVASLFEKRAQGIYHNTAVVIDADGTMLGKYRKMHIPDDPLFFEKFYFTPGDLGFPVFETKFGRVAVLICWDQWFPEAARLMALAGAQILFYPTAIGWLIHEKESLGAEQQDAWVTVQRGHAVANGLYVATVNRVGREGELDFWGRSFVADPAGKEIAVGSRQAEILYSDCDLDRIETIRRGWPFLRDRRIDAYQGLASRFLD